MSRFPCSKTAALASLAVWLTASVSFGQEIFPRIINGTPTDEFESVGIVGDQFGGFCSGTLISPYHVLTAAHCAEVINGPTNGTFQLDSGLYTTQAIFIHPDYDSFTLENDIAILELAQPVMLELPSNIFRSTPIPGDELIIVGFGSGGDVDGADGTFGVKMYGFVTIDAVDPTLIVWTFDDPSESNTAPGDSGGPGFIDIDGELLIASITSGGSLPDAGLGDMAFNTRVDTYQNWIDDIVDSIVMIPPDEPGDEIEEPQPDDEMMCPGEWRPEKPHKPHQEDHWPDTDFEEFFEDLWWRPQHGFWNDDWWQDDWRHDHWRGNDWRGGHDHTPDRWGHRSPSGVRWLDTALDRGPQRVG